MAGKFTRLNVPGFRAGEMMFMGDTPPTQQVYRSAPFVGLTFKF
jgi:hypothetical protein